MGLEIAHMEQGCCGLGAGSFIASPELYRELSDRALERLVESGADTLVTTCAGCLLQWRSLVGRAGIELDVVHPLQLLGPDSSG